MNSSSFTRGFKDGVPIGLGYLSVAFTFGIMAVRGGLSIAQAALISMTNVTSAGQLAGLELMIASAPLFEMALTQLVINLRYALMSRPAVSAEPRRRSSPAYDPFSEEPEGKGGFLAK